MKIRTLKYFAVIIVSILLISCGGSKTIFKTTVDSTRVQELQDSLSLSKSESEFYQNMVNSLRYSGIYFDTISHPCDSTNKNEVSIDPNGGINAKGNIKYVFVSDKKEQKEQFIKKDKYDSLLQVKQKVVTETKTNTVQKIVHRGLKWYWFLIFFIGGYLFHKYKNNFPYLKFLP